ncbi:hypothetical protein VUR80DRAFT_2075 [Thermomyces stellatus]
MNPSSTLRGSSTMPVEPRMPSRSTEQPTRPSMFRIDIILLGFDTPPISCGACSICVSSTYASRAGVSFKGVATNWVRSPTNKDHVWSVTDSFLPPKRTSALSSRDNKSPSRSNPAETSVPAATHRPGAEIIVLAQKPRHSSKPDFFPPTKTTTKKRKEKKKKGKERTRGI